MILVNKVCNCFMKDTSKHQSVADGSFLRKQKALFTLILMENDNPHQKLLYAKLSL